LGFAPPNFADQADHPAAEPAQDPPPPPSSDDSESSLSALPLAIAAGLAEDMFLQDTLVAWFTLCPAVRAAKASSMSHAAEEGNKDGDEGKDEGEEGRIEGEPPELE